MKNHKLDVYLYQILAGKLSIDTDGTPFYDMISTVYYPNLASKMAMKVGSKYDFDGLFPRHFIQMAEEALLSSALVGKEVLSLKICRSACLDGSSICL